MITVTIDTSDLTRKLADFPEALARAQELMKKVRRDRNVFMRTSDPLMRRAIYICSREFYDG